LFHVSAQTEALHREFAAHDTVPCCSRSLVQANHACQESETSRKLAALEARSIGRSESVLANSKKLLLVGFRSVSRVGPSVIGSLTNLLLEELSVVSMHGCDSCLHSLSE